MNKSFDNALSTEKISVTSEDMKLINKYSQLELKKEDVFVFSVILCDNEIDRDFERFTVASLNTLAKLFVGKTAIKNHSMNSDDQSARTFKTEVVIDESKKNSLGEDYTYLKAYCYIPRIEKYETLIAEIQSGIKKEVSIGCAVSKSVCSVCSKDTRSGICRHKRGKKYDGKLCYYELEEPTDAYEWSFVAVPAQRNAGVTKGFETGEKKNMNDVLKMITNTSDSVTLSADEVQEISSYINALSEKAKYGEEYRAELEKETVKLLAFTLEELSSDVTKSIVSAVSTQELKLLNASLKAKKKKIIAPVLAGTNTVEEAVENSQFRF